MGNRCSSASRGGEDRDSVVSNSESSQQCCRVRSHKKKKSSIGNVDEIKQEPVNGSNNKAESSSGGETAAVQSQQTQQQLPPPIKFDPREESSMASVDSELMAPAAQRLGKGAIPAAGSSSAHPGASTTSAVDQVAAIPDTLRQLPEALRQVLHGCMTALPAAERGAHLTVYVTSADPAASSTTSALVKAVEDIVEGPEGLKLLAASRGTSLQILWDPWGTHSSLTSSSASSSDDRIGRISLSNLNRLMETSHVIPVLIFGDALGRTCLPLSVEAQDFQSAFQMSPEGIIQQEDRDLVETWYRADDQAQPPCYRLQSNAASTMGEEVQRRLLEIFITVFNPELSDAYLTTLFEQEVHNSVCMSQELARRCVWIQEPWTVFGSTPSAATTPCAEAPSIAERENRRRVNAVHRTLKNLLQEKHIIRSHPDAAITLLSTTLHSIVEELLDEIESREVSSRSTIPRSFLEDVSQHLTFCQKAASCSVNRESALMAIKRYMTGNERQPLIVYGAEGSGKTCLMARAAQHCHSWIQPAQLSSTSSDPNDSVDMMGLVLRFARLTPKSSSILTLLHSINRQLSILLTGRLPSTAHTLSDYRSTMYGLLDGPASSKQRITFILDGIDHLDEFDSSSTELLSSWLPAQLPPNVKVVLTLRNGEHLEQLRNHLPESSFHQLEELSATEAHNLFDACLLQQAAHRSHGDHLAAMAGQINQSHRPLTVKILSWQAGLAEEFRTDGGDLLPCSTNIIPNLSTALEQLTNLQKEDVGLMIALLTSSRFGLCDYEMENLCRIHLGSDKKSCWPTLAHFLGPFLQRTIVGGLGLLTWRDVTIRQQMKDTFLTPEIHGKMLDYYWALWKEGRSNMEARNWTDLATPGTSTNALRLKRRALDEIPYHLSRLEDPTEGLERWKEIWSDPAWLLAKLATSGVAQLCEDLLSLTPAEARPPTESLQKWILLSAPALDYDYRQVTSQKIGWGAEAADSSKMLVPCLVPGQICLGDQKATEDHQEVCISAIHRLSHGDRHYAAALSAVKDEMSLWNFTACQCDKVVGNLEHQPLKVAPLANDRCVMLCGRELRVYDIKTGNELLKLKGMMNQKLPLFGLHGDSHVVSLSRNRMYVNLISLESGDCVTTFKVGEDRFLNSLLVSENGRILVCGDESKRPCSLLVWDLQAKKLIYDLKMLHHEFTTRLSAITGDGTYVACVCKELETNDPDFIVVYDLQSGTLFKKWKSGSNTVALTIGCQNTCVVTSLHDGRILVWDLGTGNCRWSLVGHAAAIDTLNLDEDGFMLLSWDSRDSDRSLRLWNLSNGQDVATFTPDRRVTAAQLSADGRVVLLALAGRSDLVQLKLCQPST